MALGGRVRALFGKNERLVTELWRRMFIDLDHWTRMVRSWHPVPKRILEVGCGEGAGTERLAAAFPDAEIVAIDIMPHLGRLFRGPPDRVSFRVAFAEELAAHEPGAFDLIVMCDVLHHVPANGRLSLLEAIKTLLSPGGVFAFKDWGRAPTPIHWLCYAADRWLTGDRIAYLTPPEAYGLLAGVFGAEQFREQQRIKPWRNNYAFAIQR